MALPNKSFISIRKKSIQSHLLALGAPYNEVYTTDVAKKNRLRTRSPLSAHRRSQLLDTLSKREILGWAEYLYKKRLTEWHPDRHPNEQEKYTKMCQELGQEFEALKIKLKK